MPSCSYTWQRREGKPNFSKGKEDCLSFLQKKNRKKKNYKETTICVLLRIHPFDSAEHANQWPHLQFSRACLATKQDKLAGKHYPFFLQKKEEEKRRKKKKGKKKVKMCSPVHTSNSTWGRICNPTKMATTKSGPNRRCPPRNEAEIRHGKTHPRNGGPEEIRMRKKVNFYDVSRTKSAKSSSSLAPARSLGPALRERPCLLLTGATRTAVRYLHLSPRLPPSAPRLHHYYPRPPSR